MLIKFKVYNIFLWMLPIVIDLWEIRNYSNYQKSVGWYRLWCTKYVWLLADLKEKHNHSQQLKKNISLKFAHRILINMADGVVLPRLDSYNLSQKAGRPRLFRAGMEAVNFPY